MVLDSAHFPQVGPYRICHTGHENRTDEETQAGEEQRVSYSLPVLMQEIALEKRDNENSADRESRRKTDRPSPKSAQSLFWLPVDY